MLKVKTEDGFKTVNVLASTSGLADKYNENVSYSVGDYCVYKMILYICTGNTSGTWDATKWSSVLVTNMLKSFAQQISSFTNHIIDTSNPHEVTASQVGAPTTAELTSHTSNTSNPHGVTAAQVGARANNWNPAIADCSGTLAVDKGGTGSSNGATGLKNLFSAGNTILSSYQYGTTLPTSGKTAGRIFFLKA